MRRRLHDAPERGPDLTAAEEAQVYERLESSARWRAFGFEVGGRIGRLVRSFVNMLVLALGVLAAWLIWQGQYDHASALLLLALWARV